MQVRNAQLWVHDQAEALDFYTNKIGWEVRSDATLPEMGNFRWLTVGPADQPDIAIVLMAIPGPPVMDPDTADQVRSLMAKGFAGTVFLVTDNVDGDFERLSEAFCAHIVEARRLHRFLARAGSGPWIWAASFAGVAGRSIASRRSASAIALAMHTGVDMQLPSPTPLAPSGVKGDGDSRCRMTGSGTSMAVGSR